MFERFSALKNAFHNRQNAIETNLASLQNVLAAVKKRRLDALSDGQLKEMAGQLKREAQRGAALDDLLVEATAEGVDLEEEGLKGPSSTLTYLIDDSPDQFSRLPLLIKLAKNSISGPVLKLQAHYQRIFGQINGK